MASDTISRIIPLSLFVLLSAFTQLGANAAPITFTYEGQISRQEAPFFDAGYAVGTPLTFSYTFDPDLVTSTRWEGPVGASEFVYEWFNGGWSFEMNVGGDVYMAAHSDGVTPFDIRVENDVTTTDRYGVRVRKSNGKFDFPSGSSSSLLQLFLSANDTTLFGDTSLPLSAPDAPGVVGSFFGAHLQAAVNGPAAVVPIPPTLVLMLSALISIVSPQRKKLTAILIRHRNSI